MARTIEQVIFQQNILKLIFNATLWANLGENASSAPATNLYVSLHTAQPSSGDDQTSNEAGYGAYARVAVARTSSGWTVNGDSVAPVANVIFPTATNAGTTASGGTETETWMGVGLAASGAGHLFFSTQLGPALTVALGVTPTLANGSAQQFQPFGF